MQGRKLVIKIGSGVLSRDDGVALDGSRFVKLVAAIADLHAAGNHCLVVSSGAAAAGLMEFGIKERPDDLSMLQACCAVGQTRLMHTYETLFRHFDLRVAQILLTNEDIRTPERERLLSNTLERLFILGEVIPIANENDSVAVEELKFGDNDELSARLAVLVGADRLIMLTSVDGLMDAEGAVIPSVGSIDEAKAHVNGEKGGFSVGGMATKLEAVRTAVESGIPAVIASGVRADQLAELADGRGIGTHFQKP